jgi:hypothetical protein
MKMKQKNTTKLLNKILALSKQQKDLMKIFLNKTSEKEKKEKDVCFQGIH